MNERKEEEKESTWQQQALKTPPFSATSCACGLPSMASPSLPQCSCYACSHCLCLRAQLATLGPDVHQALLKACFGACAEADSHLLQHKDLSVGDLESSLQLLAEQDESNAKD